MEVGDGLLLPKVYGINALGTGLSVYKYHSITRIHPLAGLSSLRRRDYDVVTPEGETKFKQIVGEIKEVEAALSGSCTHYSLLLPLF